VNIYSVHRSHAAAMAWNRHFGRALSRLRAQVLVDVMLDLESPTVRDLVMHLGDDVGETYDPWDPDRAEVALGDLVGRPGTGPSVSELVAAVEAVEADESVLDRRLADILKEKDVVDGRFSLGGIRVP